MLLFCCSSSPLPSPQSAFDHDDYHDDEKSLFFSAIGGDGTARTFEQPTSPIRVPKENVKNIAFLHKAKHLQR